MERLRFRELELEAFVHATESRDAVERALHAVAPGARIEREGLTGHFGQPLVVVRARVRDGVAVEDAITRVAKAVGAEVARTAARRLDEHGKVYARLDKQAAAGGRIALAGPREHDIIKFTAKLRSPGKSSSETVAFVQERFGGPEARGLDREEESSPPAQNT